MLNIDFAPVHIPDVKILNRSLPKNPITHNQIYSLNLTNEKNMFYHQKEERDVSKHRQKMLLNALNEQRRLEKQRKNIDKQFELFNDYKIKLARSQQIAKEDQDKEDYRRRFEEVSRINDVRLDYYLSNYYLPPEEKNFRTKYTDRFKNGVEQKKIRVMKKKKVDVYQN